MDAVTPHPIVRPDLIDDKGNLRAADISMTWQGSDTLLYGLKVVGPNAAEPPLRPRPATSTPYVPVREHVSCHMSTPPPVQPSCLEVADRPLHRTTQESRQGYRPATPIQRFKNKSLNWPSWFCHFKAVADVSDLGSMIVCDATMRMRMLTPMPLLSCAALDIQRARRSSVKNSLVNNLSGDSQTQN